MWQEHYKRRGNDRRFRSKGELSNALEAVVMGQEAILNVFSPLFPLISDVPLFWASNR